MPCIHVATNNIRFRAHTQVRPYEDGEQLLAQKQQELKDANAKLEKGEADYLAGVQELETAQEQLAFSDGAIVGSCFKELGEAEYPVDEERVKLFMQMAKP